LGGQQSAAGTAPCSGWLLDFFLATIQMNIKKNLEEFRRFAYLFACKAVAHITFRTNGSHSAIEAKITFHRAQQATRANSGRISVSVSPYI
jgi:hypothetical protein